ncbi:MAG TPA: dihydrodipicolinate synthase family protein [Opitutaceae bacterium]|nr:dihydrodipicolinate synthase family protein [Opitutaceae bacterium]
MKTPPSLRPGLSRRDFLQRFGAGALALGLMPRGFAAAAERTAAGKPLRGIFPIAQTPFTPSDQIDLGALVKQVEFIDRGGVQGFVWPQLASEWTTLSESERMAGMEAVGQAGRKAKTAIVLGVQGADLGAVRRYIKQADRVGADAIIALPPAENTDPKTALSYYQEIGKSTGLPLFVQAVGNMDVDLLLELYRTIPTMRYVKDEAGDPLQRVGPLREKSHDEIKVFSGGHGRKLIEEMEAGFSGSMPAAGFADMYVTTYELWHAGKHEEAKANHQRTLDALNTMLRYGTEGMKYVLVARGVFSTYSARKPPPGAFTTSAKAATGAKAQPLDEEGRKTLQALVQSLKPSLRA